MTEQQTSPAAAQADIDAIEKMMQARKAQADEATSDPAPDAAAVAQQAEQLAAAQRQQAPAAEEAPAPTPELAATPADAPAPPAEAPAEPAAEPAAEPPAEVKAPAGQAEEPIAEETPVAEETPAQPVEEPIKAAETTPAEAPAEPVDQAQPEPAAEPASAPAAESTPQADPQPEAPQAAPPVEDVEPAATPEPASSPAPSADGFTFKDAIVDLVEAQKRALEEQTFEANCRAENLAEQWGNFIKLNEDIAQLGMVFRKEADLALTELGFAPDTDNI